MPGHEVIHLATHGFLHSIPLLNGIVAYRSACVTAEDPDRGEITGDVAHWLLTQQAAGEELSEDSAEVEARTQEVQDSAEDRFGHEEDEPARERGATLLPAGDDPLSRGWDTLTDDAYYDDGFLTMSEVMGIPLAGCELVVLSCCHSAEGEIAPGEGVMGLSQGFIYAGARAVLASLTKVDDEATRRLMVEFYRNWREEGLSKREALRRAKQALAADPEFAAPRFWAPFVLYGAE